MAKQLKKLKAELLKDAAVRQAYEELGPAYEMARAIIAARAKSKLTQVELAELMGTSQSFIAKIESGRHLPSMTTLLRVAKATNTKPRIAFEAA